MAPTIAMEFVASAVRAAVHSGIEQPAVLKMTGLTLEDITDRTKQVPLPQHIQLLETVAAIHQDECFGLRYGLNHHLSDFGVLGYVLLNSATVGSALNQLIQYFEVWQQATEVALTLDGDTAWFSYQITDATIQTRKQDAETAIAFSVASIRTLTRQHWCPKAVWLEHSPPRDTSEYERLLNAPVFFDQPVNAIAIERKLLEETIPLADRTLLPMLESHLQTFMAQREVGNQLIASVCQTIAQSLPQGCITLEKVAAGLGMSGRTLQRYLRDRNVTFKQLVNETRYRQAMMYLEESKLTLTEIAFMLGYSELSAFNHAFKSWTGLTPRKYRQSALER